MARKKTTVYIEEDLLRAAKVSAVREGKKEYQVFEDALRSHLGLEDIERIWQRNALGERAALELATKEVHAARRERAAAPRRRAPRKALR